ncbi:MAG: tetratricopeptide repeat protein [bacterium]|nr:tetratricopeptide repeat protein [bacterium]
MILETRKKILTAKINKRLFQVFLLVCFTVLFILPGCRMQEEKLFREAYNYWQTKDYETAIITYLKLIENYPGSKHAPYAQFQIGNIYNYNLNRYQDAVIAYQKTVSIYPDSEYSFKAQFEIAEIYNKRFDEKQLSIIEYKRLFNYKQNKTEFPKIHLEIADNYIYLKQFDKALFELEELKKETPNYPNLDYILFKEAMILYQKGDFTSAKDEFENFMVKYPESDYFLKAQFWYAQTLEELKNYSEALELYQTLKENEYKTDIIDLKIERLNKLIKEEKEKKKNQR